VLKAVIDTNVIISALLAINGEYWNLARFVFQTALLDEARFENITSVPIVRELGDVLSRPHFGLDTGQIVDTLALFSDASTFVDIFNVPMGVRDSKDDKIVETAMNANADCIVTRDSDLFDPRAWYGIAKVGPGIRSRPIRVVALAEFVAEIDGGPRFSAFIPAGAMSRNG
jgi:putative PIN family toxin of toxin-antitoxin system